MSHTDEGLCSSLNFGQKLGAGQFLVRDKVAWKKALNLKTPHQTKKSLTEELFEIRGEASDLIRSNKRPHGPRHVSSLDGTLEQLPQYTPDLSKPKYMHGEIFSENLYDLL